jgi:23S rRNA (guanine745-N1)-methyltransferase
VIGLKTLSPGYYRRNEMIDNGTFICPLCHKQLFVNGMQLQCSSCHSYDISKKGYVNLLLVNQKNAKDPGDNKEMLLSRKKFLNKGYYLKLSKRLNEIIKGIIFTSNSDENKNILDAGCGEGYFIYNLKNSLSELKYYDKINYFGIDISKSAINYASSREKGMNFAVASIHNLPLESNSMDVLIRNFAPEDENEFQRVVKTHGKIIIIAPGTDHLYGLKRIIYEKPIRYEEKVEKLVNYNLISNEKLKYKIKIGSNSDILNLLSMTPYYWNIGVAGRKKLDVCFELETDLDFNISIYEKI